MRPPCTLPPLRGAAWWAFLVAWLATVALALYIAASFAPVFKASPPDSYLYGFALNRTALTGVSGDDAVVQFTLGSEAGATGLRAGDRVTAVNGIPIGDAASFGAAMQRLGRPDAIRLSTVPSDGHAAVRQLTRSPVHYEQGYALSGLTMRMAVRLPNGIYLFADVFAPLALAALLLARQARDPIAPWVSLVAALWPCSVGPPISYAIAHSGPALWWVGQTTGLLGSWGLIVVLALFPTARFSPR